MIQCLEKVCINNTDQWVLVQGNENAPLILHVQAGPGLPMIPEAKPMQKMLGLENDFLVAYWDQRSCGKSFDKNLDPKTINLAQLADDIVSCTLYLLKRYKKNKAILVGYSIGATTGLMAASKVPDLFEHLFLAGIDIDIPSANRYALDFAQTRAKKEGKIKTYKQAIELGKTPITNAELFQKRAKILTDLEGIMTGSSYSKLLRTTVSNMLFSKHYKLSDIPKTIKGMEFCQNALLPELDTFNLFDVVKEVSVPAHIIQGKLDGVTPYQTTVRYYEYLNADEKTITLFEHSAHMPHYEEPEKFKQLIKKECHV